MRPSDDPAPSSGSGPALQAARGMAGGRSAPVAGRPGSRRPARRRWFAGQIHRKYKPRDRLWLWPVVAMAELPGVLDQTDTPADRITPDRVRAYLADLERHNSHPDRAQPPYTSVDGSGSYGPAARLVLAQSIGWAGPSAAPTGPAKASSVGCSPRVVRSGCRPDGRGRAQKCCV